MAILVIEALALAAAIAAGPDVYIDADGCRWARPAAVVRRKKTILVQLRPPTAAASAPAPHKAKPKRRSIITPSPSGDELLGCDEGAPPPLSILPPAAPFSPVPDDGPTPPLLSAGPGPEISPPVRVPDVPPSPGLEDEPPPDAGPPRWSGPPALFGPPLIFAGPIPAVPEPRVVYLLVAGLGAIAVPLFTRRRRR